MPNMDTLCSCGHSIPVHDPIIGCEECDCEATPEDFEERPPQEEKTAVMEVANTEAEELLESVLRLTSLQEDAFLLGVTLEYGRLLAALLPQTAGQELQEVQDRAAQCTEAIKILRRRNT